MWRVDVFLKVDVCNKINPYTICTYRRDSKERYILASREWDIIPYSREAFALKFAPLWVGASGSRGWRLGFEHGCLVLEGWARKRGGHGRSLEGRVMG